MIYLLCPGDLDPAATIVQSGLERSCGVGQIRRISIAEWIRLQALPQRLLSVIISPPDSWGTQIVKGMQRDGDKILLLGVLPPTIAHTLSAVATIVNEELKVAAQCKPAPTYSQSNSALIIEYSDFSELGVSPIKERACLRYDFTDEWNNLGYGAVRADGSIWALSQCVQLPKEKILACLKLGGQDVSAYAGFWVNEKNISNTVLWFNRPVGPVDSQEWRLVENFISTAGFPGFVCQPVLSEIPYGYEAAVTMRLDCDEDVESARMLWQAYQAMNVPFSLALHARVLGEEKHHVLARDVLLAGGALLSHTATHAPDWGGSYVAAFEEGRISAEAIVKATGFRVRYAVSPFHQTPIYARDALTDAGYEGCIGGIIRNDYDFLMARAGTPPYSAEGFIGHSQQCMLHGDCMLTGSDPLKLYKQAFGIAKVSKSFFGYLDHPFSERYQYGWNTEDQRIEMHANFIEYIKDQGHILFVHENDAMDFLHDRASIKVSSVGENFQLEKSKTSRSALHQSVEYGGVAYPLNSELLL
ncbi:hypothetical protein M2131_000854 [Polynucleobacter sphagniphilus]|uniref:polysaccharide deacetylase n=1 Tax=Polynucleobacter sphagniphilus TaxID=1743169 RepID=UPI0024758665|nr:polysaccharide deacetylase [Polynucleobacter sphagniphilus]MDH6420913.1 hypothetical protein [Polynucleobacter sphagniphilus]